MIDLCQQRLIHNKKCFPIGVTRKRVNTINFNSILVN